MCVRLLAAGAVAATLSVGLLPAQATPYAGQFRYLSAGSVALQGADGARWLLSVGATTSGEVESRPEQRLYVDVSRCMGSSCVAVDAWSRALTAAEISITNADTPLVDTQPTTATLRTVLGGLRLDISLDGSGVGGGAFYGLGSSTSPPGVHPAVSQYTLAHGRVTVGALTCDISSSHGEIGRLTTADTLGDDARDPRTAPPAQLPAGLLTGKHHASC